MCGIFGVYGHQEAANLTYLGLHALQHRGQESAGIAVSDGDRIRTERRMGLELDGSIFQSTSDSEVIVHLLARARELELPGRVISALKRIEGAYSLLFLSENQMVAARDPRGFRPLCIGRIKEAFVFSSETVAFDLIGAEFIREVEPGELVVADGKGLHS